MTKIRQTDKKTKVKISSVRPYVSRSSRDVQLRFVSLKK